MVNVQLTKEQAESLSTLLAILTGKLQYRALNTPNGSLDDSWAFWNALEKQVSHAHGWQAYLVADKFVNDLLDNPK